jgi:predicted nucleotidyltransferase
VKLLSVLLSANEGWRSLTGQAMSRARIDIPKGRITEFCRQHHIRRFALFGSVLRDDFGPGSDVDILVDFEPEHVPGFLGLYELEQQLSALLGGVEVDLITEKFLNRRIRGRVLAEAEVQYAGG